MYVAWLITMLLPLAGRDMVVPDTVIPVEPGTIVCPAITYPPDTAVAVRVASPAVTTMALGLYSSAVGTVGTVEIASATLVWLTMLAITLNKGLRS